MRYAGKEGDTCEENSFTILSDNIRSFCFPAVRRTRFWIECNNIVQSAGSIALTGNLFLRERKKKEWMIIPDAIQPIMRIFQIQSICSGELPHKARSW